jgi:hypothetical protein
LEEVRSAPGEVLILFRDGLSKFEREMYLHRLFAEEYNRGRHVGIKREHENGPLMQTTDGGGMVLEVPKGYEGFYIALIKDDHQIQFVQRHHYVRALKTALPPGH